MQQEHIHAGHATYWEHMYTQSLYIPLNAFLSLLLTLHAISEAATMTDPTTRTTTTATTVPMMTADPFPGCAFIPLAGVRWCDVASGATELLVTFGTAMHTANKRRSNNKPRE